jgi:hypothetical protein
MAELTNLESKLGEVIGLAMAAQGATQKVSRLDDLDGDLEQELERMQSEAKEAEERATEVAGGFEGKKTAILDEAREVKQKAKQMMSTYLDQAADALDGYEFLTMAEAGEVGHWEILATLDERAGKARVRELAGCGGHARRADPQLAHGDAAQLVSLARRVAEEAPTDGCAAKRDIAVLSAKAHALVAAGRVPVRLRAQLLAGVAAVEADAPACTPPAPAPAPAATPAPAPAQAPVEDGKGHEKHKDHGHGKGHGHDENQDEG